MAEAKVIARDVGNDLAYLRTGLSAKKTAAFRTSIRLGETVEAFGYPLTDVLAKSGNFTLGNVSALVGIGEDSRYLQISAPVQPGNSGGPLARPEWKPRRRRVGQAQRAQAHARDQRGHRSERQLCHQGLDRDQLSWMPTASPMRPGAPLNRCSPRIWRTRRRI